MQSGIVDVAMRARCHSAPSCTEYGLDGTKHDPHQVVIDEIERRLISTLQLFDTQLSLLVSVDLNVQSGQPSVEQGPVGIVGGAGIHADQIVAGSQVGRVCAVRKALRSRHHTSDGAGARRHAEPSAHERKTPKQCTKPTQDDDVTIQPTKETIGEAA